MASLQSRSLTVSNTLRSNIKSSEYFHPFQSTGHDRSIDTHVLIQLIPVRLILSVWIEIPFKKKYSSLCWLMLQLL